MQPQTGISPLKGLGPATCFLFSVASDPSCSKLAYRRRGKSLSCTSRAWQDPPKAYRTSEGASRTCPSQHPDSPQLFLHPTVFPFQTFAFRLHQRRQRNLPGHLLPLLQRKALPIMAFMGISSDTDVLEVTSHASRFVPNTPRARHNFDIELSIYLIQD